MWAGKILQMLHSQTLLWEAIIHLEQLLTPPMFMDPFLEVRIMQVCVTELINFNH